MADPSFESLMLANKDRPLGWSLRFATAEDHASRVQILERILDDIYIRLNEGRRHNHSLSEDQLNVKVVDMLAMASIDASHDTEVGGHCDVLVRAPDNFLWIGEAKIFNGASYVAGGFEQLSTRYGSALPGRDHGEIIIYCKQSNISQALGRWKEFLEENFKEVLFVETKAPDPTQFRTTHLCPNTGETFHVRHKIVPLHHDPKK